ncbi:hypothetical protein CBER1_02036 [Cercospora berteroae]|uniref:Solute-binding protein family 5 domain-containing protein n=1 Tax=Cercospora berteroae TaxID=357750 RepID=A0A2S6CMN4_9PEZI|nr:hypothetical protein CBER1_02036 [Cercospora berteroae]
MPTTTKSLRIALENVDFRLPTQVTDDNSVLALKSLVVEPLITWRPHGEFKPGLFASWTASPDARIWSFHIREGATYHDGVPCKADGIVDYIKGFLDSTDYFGMKWSYARYFATTTFSASDDRTVRVESVTPFGGLPQIFNDFWPCRINEDGKPDLGTGPYRVAEFSRQDGRGHAVLELIDASTNTHLPATITAIHESSASKRLPLLGDNTVDLALNLERTSDLSLLDFQPPLLWGRQTSTLSVIYYLNNFNGLFSHPSARLAANLAISTTDLIQDVYHGLAKPAATAVSPSTSDSAKQTCLQSQVKVEYNRPEYARSIGLNKDLGDLALFDSTPHTTFRVLDDKVSQRQSTEKTWWMGYRDEEFERLFEDARNFELAAQVADNRDGNGKGRAELYAKCLKRLQENPPWIYVAHPDVVWAAREGVDVDVGPTGVLRIK